MSSMSPSSSEMDAIVVASHERFFRSLVVSKLDGNICSAAMRGIDMTKYTVWYTALPSRLVNRLKCEKHLCKVPTQPLNILASEPEALRKSEQLLLLLLPVGRLRRRLPWCQNRLWWRPVARRRLLQGLRSRRRCRCDRVLRFRRILLPPTQGIPQLSGVVCGRRTT